MPISDKVKSEKINPKNHTRLVLIILVAILSGAVLYFVSRQNYLLFHGIVETFSIVIAFTIFAIAWNSRRVVRNSYFLFVGIAFPAIAAIGLIHTLAYKGMGVFPANDANPATQLWIASRYLLSVSLLVAPLTLGRKWNLPLFISVFVIADVIIFTTIFSGVFPVAYITGSGLTPFKVVSEYIISLILLGAIGILLTRRKSLNPDFIKLMIVAMVILVASEMAFTLYSDVFGITNAIGHLLTVAAYYLVYKALIEMTLVKPYDSLFRELKQSELSLARQTSELTSTNNRLVQEAAERKKAEQEISQQERRYHETLDRMLEGCQIIDFDWRYVYINDSAARHGRYTKDQLLGRTMMEIYPGIESTEMFARIKQTMEQRQPYRMENEFKYQDGTKSWFELSIQPVPEGIFILSLDISERKQAEQIKDEFIGMVSHELKTPLTVIVGALSTVTGGGIPESEEQLLINDATTEANELANMIDNLLELSRQQVSRLLLRTEPVNIGNSLGNVIKKLDGKSPLHKIVIDISGNLPLLRADKVRVERILYNLIDNAIKYSPDGGEVKVTAQIRDSNMIVSVTDHGIGISPEDQKRLFQSFERIAIPGNNIKGTGLGLRVCQILVEAHGGRIWVESTPGEGSTFFFTMPI